MAEGDEEIKRNINNIGCDTSFQYPVAINVQNNDTKEITCFRRSVRNG